MWACSTCFGDPNSLLSKGAFWGILCLLAVVLVVLAGVASTIFVWVRRASAIKASADASGPPVF